MYICIFVYKEQLDLIWPMHFYQGIQIRQGIRGLLAVDV